jgi:hypothetical protein
MQGNQNAIKNWPGFQALQGRYFTEGKGTVLSRPA